MCSYKMPNFPRGDKDIQIQKNNINVANALTADASSMACGIANSPGFEGFLGYVKCHCRRKLLLNIFMFLHNAAN